MIYIRDHHEPIIDRETWIAAQEELNKRAPSPEEESKFSNRYWCSGKIICGECGGRFVSITKKLKSSQQYKAWRFIEAANHGTLKLDTRGVQVGCDNSSINHIVLGDIINFVLYSINSNREQITAELLQEIKKLSKPQKIKSTEPLMSKISVLNNKKQKLMTL